MNLSSDCLKSSIRIFECRFFILAILGGFLGVTVGNLCALLGVVCVPLRTLKCYPQIMSFMIGLAVAALSSTAILVLLPEVIDYLNYLNRTSQNVFIFSLSEVLRACIKCIEHQHKTTFDCLVTTINCWWGSTQEYPVRYTNHQLGFS